MSILAFKDTAKLQPIRTMQKFDQTNSVAPFQVFTLTLLLGSELAVLYRFNGVTHIPLVLGTDYSLTGNTISLLAGLGASELLLAVPTNRLNLNFGGVFGAVKTSSTFVVLAREPGFMYNSLLLFSQDVDVTAVALTYMDNAFTFTANQSMTDTNGSIVYGSACTGTSLTGQTINALTGLALVLNNVYIGKIIANTVDTVLIDKPTYAYVGQASDSLQLFSVGSLLFSLNVDGSIPATATFVPVLSLPNLETGNESVEVWVQDTMTIPEVATNYPNMAMTLTGIEYVDAG
jgi:hypothetical protein